MRAVDTNVVVRLITRDDAGQVRSAMKFVERGVWISHLVLAETMWVLRMTYDVTHEELVSVIEVLLNHQQVVLEDEDVVEAALHHFTRTPQLGFSDCLVLEIARKAGHLPVGTFDRKLSAIDGAVQL